MIRHRAPLVLTRRRDRPALAVLLLAATAMLACRDEPTESSRALSPAVTASGTVVLAPGARFQDSVKKYETGTRFLVKAGVHRLQSVIPKSGMIFEGEPGAVLSGGQLLTGFTQMGATWVVGGQTQEGVRTSPTMASGKKICTPKHPRCNYPEELYIDNVRQRHVASLAQVVAGTWFFDYEADKIYIRSSPAGRVVETSVTPQAFRGTGAGVTIRGLTVERYATPFTNGAIEADGPGWVIEDNEVRYNHAIGIRTGTTTAARRNNVHHNLQMGMGGSGDDAVIEDNEISYANNPQVIAYGWAAGGTKWTGTRNLVLRGNFVHHNLGPGLWTDIDNIFTLIENNRVENNSRFGIYREISYDAVIRFNTATGNGFSLPVTQAVRGGGIAIRSSPNVEIYGNTLIDNRAGIDINQNITRDGAYGPLSVANLYVHDNTVTMSAGLTGFTVGDGNPDFFTGKNNRFVNNTYNLGSQTRPFWWLRPGTSVQDSLTVAEWQAAGQDVTGTFNQP